LVVAVALVFAVAVALVFAVALAFLAVIPQRSGGICFSTATNIRHLDRSRRT
jgi:hypothetical protein